MKRSHGGNLFAVFLPSHYDASDRIDVGNDGLVLPKLTLWRLVDGFPPRNSEER